MTFAIIKLQGKQYQVSVGDKIVVDRLSEPEASTLTITDTLLYVENDSVSVGTPTVAGKSVTAKVLRQLKGDKIRVAKYKAKSRSRRVRGHRQAQTEIQIISIGGKTAASKASSVKSKPTPVKSKPVKKPALTKSKPAAKSKPVRKSSPKTKPSPKKK